MAAGNPTGADLCSGTTDGDTLAADPSFTEREITFGAGTELTSGIKYAIVIRCSNALYSLGYNDSYPNNSYANGAIADSANSGETWSSTYSDYDFWFKTKSSGVEKDTGTFSGSERLAISSTAWFAQTFTASSTYTITSVILKLNKLAGRLPGTVTVSIRATEGAPEKPINPTPTNEASDITLDQATITWEDGGGATSYDVYYGENEAGLTLVSEGQAETSFTITGIDYGPPFDYVISRTWRIDAVNAAGTTTGDVWTFTTIAFDPPLPTGITLDAGGDPTGTPTGENNMFTVKRLIIAANNKIFYEDV